MPEVVLPAGAAIASFVMAAIGWYGMLRTGVRLIHDDLKAAVSAKQDIQNTFADLDHHESELNQWKEKWMISKNTPDDVFLKLWGASDLNIISIKLDFMKSNLAEVHKELGNLTKLINEQWTKKNKFGRKALKTTYIWTKKDYVRGLMNQIPQSMKIIEGAAERGWGNEKVRPNSNTSDSTPYHTHVAHFLARIARDTRDDLNALRHCCLHVQDIWIEMDLDIFNTSSTASNYEQINAISAVAAVGHMRLDLLLRKRVQQSSELLRVQVERSTAGSNGFLRALDAFKKALRGEITEHHFNSTNNTRFCLSRSPRSGPPCIDRRSFRERIALKEPPRYDSNANQLRPSTLMLGRLATFRIAYELSQACLLFLRTTWFSELCGCGLRCGYDPNAHQPYVEFGLDMMITGGSHQLPQWPIPSLNNYITGTGSNSWCATDYQWNVLTRPLRRLGLLLLEITLGTIVFDIQTGNHGAVESFSLLIKKRSGEFDKVRITRERAFTLVLRVVQPNDDFIKALRCCLTTTFECAPTDAEWEEHLQKLYLDLAKP
jgi:hypothetical protein